ncbi:Pfs NACHT and ankyrin domain protein [Penicillium verrucosum]|uniref:Pfs NACHT and ankyrin domain protein n=1 Tax=Penicillium verrucosum TaxID=60171 RepID=UPI002545AFFA|nr:Pfs NACHT and ankyrin domain protein [Penicillium verrucosum]KAJ5927146.1 Pfs NACHT and ankyrin domain protein [Penicillium verrucosum]
MAGNINFGDRNSSLQVGNNYGTITTANSPEGSDHRTHRDKALASLKFKEIDSRKLEITTSLKETCEWLLGHEEYKTWLDEEELPQHHGFFWISGKPGAGKSTIMKFAYLDMKRRCQINNKSGHHDNPVTASFFFNARGEDLEKSVHGLYRSLLIQLLQGFPDLQVVLDDKDLIPPVAQDESIRCPPLNALKDLLHNAIILLGKRALTCFIDALDECDENDIADMVDHFEDLTEQALSQNSSFRICFSSRHYPHITLNYGIRLTLESQPGHFRDLEFYVSTRMKISDADLHQMLKSRLLDKAAGVFLWVVLVVRILNKEYRRSGFNLKRRLEELPSDLSQLFKAILLRDTENPEDLLLCILWILYAKRPLRPEEFYHALWSGLAMKQHNLVDEALPELLSSSSDTSDSIVLSSEEPDKVTIYVISSSKGLAEVTRPVQSTKKRTAYGRISWSMHGDSQQNENDSDHGRRVQFIHESVRDFLIKDKGLSDLWPDLNLSDEAMAHDVLKQCCRFYMDHDQKKTWPGEPDPRLGLKSDIVPVNDDQEGGKPALVEASRSGHKDIARLLVESGADVNHHYPLTHASRNGHGDMVKFLLEKGADIHHGSPLAGAASRGHEAILRLLINNGANVDKGCPLRLASIGGHETVVEILIESGADINKGHPLAEASKRGHEAIVNLLLSRGADANAQDQAGVTPLLYASEKNHGAVVKLLIDYGADVDREDNFGATPRRMMSLNAATTASIAPWSRGRKKLFH